MDISTITKDYTRLQKQSLNNLFDTLTLFQDHAEKTSRYWAYQMGVNNNAQAAVDQYRAVLKQGRDDARKLINEGFTNVEVSFAGIGSKQPAE
ncbi:MAG: hypothetical protein HGJ94_11375 [Desulfosarcina sp.]|nr:hypothetical protein [Desulfosarcina sp.]MBC2743195.1 hypothetical protein [Desulfosarcina sp.]MBC2766106.1 hypothetical protein [Desulfosarcina sp.]